jgi:hypothetical protein
VTRDERQEFIKVLRAHLHALDICDACAGTTRDLATEVARGGLPPRADLTRTIDEAARVIAEVDAVRAELRRVLASLGEPVA